jgi:hypothetical protein
MHNSEIISDSDYSIMLQCLDCYEIYWREFDGTNERREPTLMALILASNQHRRSAHPEPPTVLRSNFDAEALMQAQTGIPAYMRNYLSVLMRRRDFLKRKASQTGTQTVYQRNEEQALGWAIKTLSKIEAADLVSADTEEK